MYSFREPANLRSALISIIYVIAGAALFVYSLSPKAFSDELLIYDLIWLDAWSLAFFFVLVTIWLMKVSWRTKALLGIAALGIYGFVEVSLLFDGTPFSSNAYWGDQKFRQAMILKFINNANLVDFYYKDLPSFYPPLYYWLLAMYARLFSLEAFKMMKIGSMFIYLFGPFFFYMMWRKLVNPFQAVMVTLASFLLCSIGNPYVLSGPHAFLANSFFVPWWLYYIERVKNPQSSWRFYLSGGVIGAIIFSTYFYPFFIAGFLFITRGCLLSGWSYLRRASSFSWSRSMGVLAVAAILCAFYWLPPMLSLMESGIDRSRGGWHHIGSTGITFGYMDFSFFGLLFLAGICFSLHRRFAPLHRGLLILTGSVVLYLFIGSILGALDLPINLIKAKEFVAMQRGVFVGLAIAAIIRRASLNRKARVMAPIMLAIALLFSLAHVNAFGKTKLVRTARTASVPAWHVEGEKMLWHAESVFLSGYEEFYSFQPVYAFIAANEHYSHPAAQIKSRFELLCLLENMEDARLLNIALRSNLYDPVDYIMLRKEKKSQDLTVSLSNYPNRYYTKVFHFPADVTGDTLLFKPENRHNIYRVLNPPENGDAGFQYSKLASGDSLGFLMRAAAIGNHLDEVGQKELGRYLNVDWSDWKQVVAPDAAVEFGDSLRMVELRMIPEGDSIHFLFCFEAARQVRGRYKVLLHITAGDRFYNYDFSPPESTNSWERWNPIFCRRTIPKVEGEIRLWVGLYNEKGHLPGEFKCDLTLRMTESSRLTGF